MFDPLSIHGHAQPWRRAVQDAAKNTTEKMVAAGDTFSSSGPYGVTARSGSGILTDHAVLVVAPVPLVTRGTIVAEKAPLIDRFVVPGGVVGLDPRGALILVVVLLSRLKSVVGHGVRASSLHSSLHGYACVVGLYHGQCWGLGDVTQ